MKLDTYLGDWVDHIDKKELNTILNILGKEYSIKTIEPSQVNVFKAFNLCQYKDMKVLFLGMDPYPQRSVATGILFGNNSDKSPSPSLQV